MSTTEITAGATDDQQVAIAYLPIDELRLDGGTQPRTGVNDEVRREYADLYRAGKDLGGIVVFRDTEGNYWVADGFHRRWGAVDAGLDQILCVIHEGTLEDARWYSYAANQKHGLRRTVDDKRKATRAALLHPTGAGLSDSQIAEHVGVSHPFVGKIRKSLEESGQLETVTSRTGADGRTRNVSKIGKAKPKPELRVYSAEQVEAIKREVAERGIVAADLGMKCFDQVEGGDPSPEQVVEQVVERAVEADAPTCAWCGAHDFGEDERGQFCRACKESVGEQVVDQHDAKQDADAEMTPAEKLEEALEYITGRRARRLVEEVLDWILETEGTP